MTAHGAIDTVYTTILYFRILYITADQLTWLLSLCRLSAVDQHTLRVSWKPPLSEHWNGDILGYYVGYKRTSDGEEKPYLFETVEFVREQGHEHQLQVCMMITLSSLDRNVVQRFDNCRVPAELTTLASSGRYKMN